MVRASYLEIYNEELRDLLKKDVKNRLELKGRGLLAMIAALP